MTAPFRGPREEREIPARESDDLIVECFVRYDGAEHAVRVGRASRTPRGAIHVHLDAVPTGTLVIRRAGGGSL